MTEHFAQSVLRRPRIARRPEVFDRIRGKVQVVTVDEASTSLPTPVAVAAMVLELCFEPLRRSVAIEGSGEAQRGAVVVFVDVPGYAEGVDAREDVVAERTWDNRWEGAVRPMSMVKVWSGNWR
jgi:hypothetical protein